MAEPLFSIIIPHYNIPDLLMRCLKSIPISEDIQVIVVDDNSSDADIYLEKYPVLSRPFVEFYIAPKNGGPGYARNIGMKYARGRWLIFADADDFFVNDVYDIIIPHVESEADVIYFKRKAVLSDNINRESERDNQVNSYIDHYINTGDDFPLRIKRYVPWCMMIKRSLIVEHSIRFDEVLYSDDVFFSVCIGCYAKKIEVSNAIPYIVTYRYNSLSDNLYTRPGELEERARVAFRCDKFLLQHNMCRERFMRTDMLRLLGKDRKLFRYYFKRLDEIYPSKISALQDISRGRSLMFKVKLYLYSLVVWARH